MSTYQPDQRVVPCQILTFAGWIEGKLHVARKTPVLEHLNRPEPLIRVTDALLPGQTATQAFFALSRAAAMFVVPLDAAEIPPVLPDRVPHRTVWLLHGGVIVEGLLDLHGGVRVSDHLEHRTGFVGLHDCTLYVPAHHAPTTIVPRVPYLALQSDRAIGCSEIDAGPPSPG